MCRDPQGFVLRPMSARTVMFAASATPTASGPATPDLRDCRSVGQYPAASVPSSRGCCPEAAPVRATPSLMTRRGGWELIGGRPSGRQVAVRSNLAGGSIRGSGDRARRHVVCGRPVITTRRCAPTPREVRRRNGCALEQGRGVRARPEAQARPAVPAPPLAVAALGNAPPRAADRTRQPLDDTRLPATGSNVARGRR